MAKNSKDAYGAEGTTSLLSFDPDKLVLVEDKNSPLYDPRIDLPIDEPMVASILALGVQEPVLVWKDPEDGQVKVVAGRQRVKNAREASLPVKTCSFAFKAPRSRKRSSSSSMSMVAMPRRWRSGATAR